MGKRAWNLPSKLIVIICWLIALIWFISTWDYEAGLAFLYATAGVITSFTNQDTLIESGDLKSPFYRSDRLRMLGKVKSRSDNTLDDLIGDPSNPNEIKLTLNIAFSIHEKILENKTQLIDMFEKEDGFTLLVLGKPGAGKTVKLNELARDLAIRAQTNTFHHIPVIIELSSWDGQTPSFIDWLTNEIDQEYEKGIGSWFIRPLLEIQRIILLLDGFDEIKAEYKDACVISINDFIQKHRFTRIVICSSTDENTNLLSQLNVDTTIFVKPITSDQVDAALSQAGPSLGGLRDLLRLNSDLREIAKSPRMLNIMSQISQNSSLEELTKQTSILLDKNKMWAAYIKQMFEQKIKGGFSYRHDKTIRWLSWLAKNLVKHQGSNQGNIFFVEHLQPNWLSTRLLQWQYAITSRLLIGLSLILPFAFTSILYAIIVETPKALHYANLAPSLDLKILSYLLIVLIIIASSILVVVLHSALFLPPFLGLGVVDGLQFQKKTSNTNNTTMQIFNIAINLVGIGMLFGPWYGLIINIIPGVLQFLSGVPLSAILISGFGTILLWILFGGLLFGIRRVNQNVAYDNRTVENIGWSLSKSFRGALIGSGIATLSLASTFFLAWITSNRDNFTTTHFPLFLLTYIFVGAAIGGIRRKIGEPNNFPNQGIHLSLKYSLILGVLCIPTILPIILITFVVIFGPTMAQLFSSITIAILISSCVSLSFGWREVVQHYTLRCMLWWEGGTPLNLIGFLDYASRHALLTRFGGGYKFYDPDLMDYFADYKI